MRALLDTHSFLWAAIQPEKLPARLRKLIADPQNDINVSTVTFWEISLKFALGKLELAGCTPEDMVPAAESMGFSIVAPSAAETASFHRLPKAAHKDPFDRMLIWQCLHSDWTLVSKDGALDAYREMGLKTCW